MLQAPDPILVSDRFPALLDSLLSLLADLTPGDWERPTVAAGWTVKDVAAHLLGDDIGLLSRRRDGFREAEVSFSGWTDLVAWINRRNQTWVDAARRISPALLCALLRFTGDQVSALIAGLDQTVLGAPVSWAGPDPAPVWLDVAREFTERWHHQQHIRMAAGLPGLLQPYYLAPVLAAFVHGVPQAYRDVAAPDGLVVTLAISGESGGIWSVLRERGGWKLYSGRPENPDALVEMPDDIAWRLFTRGISSSAARQAAQLSGDHRLAEKMFETVSIIA